MKQVFRLITAFPLLLLLGSISHADEFRGLYVDAFHPGFKSHAEVTQMVGAAKAANFNAVIVQVRKRGDAYYNSHIEPKASDIPAGYDPLADILAQAHAVGMEVHAWLSVYEVALDSKWFKAADRSVHLAHPEWLMSDAKGKTTLANGKVYVDPGVPAVRDHFVSIVQDIVRNYSLDGIHLDNVRYPGPDAGYNSVSLSRFRTELNREDTPATDDADWCRWRRNQVTDLVDTVHQAVVARRPQVKLSASVMSCNPEIAATYFLQEWHEWTKEKLVDFLVPMIFTKETSIRIGSDVALTASFERHIYVGIGAWRLTTDAAARQIEDARAAGAHGIAVYSYHYLGPNSTSSECTRLPDLRTSVFTESALPAAMTWRD